MISRFHIYHDFQVRWLRCFHFWGAPQVQTDRDQLIAWSWGKPSKTWLTFDLSLSHERQVLAESVSTSPQLVLLFKRKSGGTELCTDKSKDSKSRRKSIPTSREFNLVYDREQFLRLEYVVLVVMSPNTKQVDMLFFVLDKGVDKAERRGVRNFFQTDRERPEAWGWREGALKPISLRGNLLVYAIRTIL